MTANDFRKAALELPGAVEAAHMNHPDFRVNGRIFASLGYPDEGWGMVKLTPEQQRSFITRARDAFKPCNGAWGRGGATNVHLASANQRVVRTALNTAFGNITLKTASTAPKKPKNPSRRLNPPSARKCRARLVALVKSLPEATAVPAGDRHLSLEARGRRFGWFLDDHHGDGRLALNLKAATGVSKTLVAKAPDRFHLPKYLGHRGWIGVWLDFPSPNWSEIKELLRKAYCLRRPT